MGLQGGLYRAPAHLHRHVGVQCAQQGQGSSRLFHRFITDSLLADNKRTVARVVLGLDVVQLDRA